MTTSIDRRTLLIGALAGTAFARRAAGAPGQPNILHIMTDQQQWATLAGRSECRTPNLNRLAQSGMQFNRSYTPTAVCCPARAMLLSGAYHWRNGVYNQVHSPPSVHRDMNPDVVLYSHTAASFCTRNASRSPAAPSTCSMASTSTSVTT